MISSGMNMPHQIRKRIARPATREETVRHQQIREQIAQELPELQQWAKEVAARHKQLVPIGTVLRAEEAPIVEAIDNYAAAHSLRDRAAVVREALARLLGIEIARQ
jgi:hypothetical protein